MADSSTQAGATASPFLAQYFAAKAAHPDALLFFRMGDFYELFFSDAVDAAATLGIALTKRGQHKGEDIPMAGVPWRQADAYLLKLIRAGHRVAICEQMEDPAEAKKRGSKSIVRRDVVRVVTPGTLTEDALLDARAPNRLAALAFGHDECALAWTDVSTGELETRRCALAHLEDELAALGAAEVLVADRDAARAPADAPVTMRPALKADPRWGEQRLRALHEVATLDAFGDFSAAELSALALLIDYVELTQAGLAARLAPPRQARADAVMAIDAASRAALEIDRTLRGGRDATLLAAVDRTLTGPGARTLGARLAAPLLDVGAISRRLDAVSFFVTYPESRAGVRAELRRAGDVSRCLTRALLGRAGPRDLAALRDGLCAGDRAAVRCLGVTGDAPSEIEEACRALSSACSIEMAHLTVDLERALAPDLPLVARDGGFIAPGYDPTLDEARALRDHSRAVIAALQSDLAAETGIANLKIRHNGVLGYHIEVTAKHADALLGVAHAARFIHRQTIASAARFTTGELIELDAKIARAGETALARELALFQDFVRRVGALERPIRAAGAALAVLDVSAALAEWAEETGAVRPEIEESGALIAEGARHPVVEAALKSEGKGFTANDVRLDAAGQAGARLLLVTGPNMAGKSTYLRQIALVAILAQAGSFVPARRLKLGLVDRLFARVGASDDLARGRSTFMTEMVETAAILNQAGPRSLVVVDEIGRGTATYDGLALAWATSEHLHEVNRCRAVFATHYHELTSLSEKLSACANAHLRAREWKGDLVFLHEVAPGPADRSYGVQVAKLAGAPKAVVERARALLARLEAGRGPKGGALMSDLPLFESAPAAPSEPSPVDKMLAELDIDALSPREAQALLYQLKDLSRRD